MKKLYTLLMLCFSFHHIKGQQSNFSETINHIFENLDFSEVTTGWLLERSIPFVRLDSFDGTTLADFNKMDVDKLGLSPYVKVCLPQKIDSSKLASDKIFPQFNTHQ